MSEQSPLPVLEPEASARSRRRRRERWLGVAALIALVVAWVVGGQLQRTDRLEALTLALPELEGIEVLGDGLFAHPDCWIAVGQADGYGGPLRVAAAVDREGAIAGVAVIEHRETAAWMSKVQRSGLLRSFDGQRPGALEVDAITGATLTSDAITAAAAEAARTVGNGPLGMALPEPPPPAVVFGVPEITLLLLLVVGFAGHRRWIEQVKALRWAMLITGMLVLGFWFNVPLTISRVNLFLTGWWPQWQTGLYWYLLIFGLFAIATVDDRNAYCAWFCPFGAVQECMGAIGAARSSGPKRWRRAFKWFQRGLAFAAIALALLFRNPGLTSFEPFGAMFDLTGSSILFAALGIVLVLSLFVRRPWCNFLCPMDPAYDLIRALRRWMKESWKSAARP